MKFLIVCLALVAIKFSFAQESREQVCSHPTESCTMSFRVLHGLSKNQERGLISRDLNIRSLEKALDEGRVTISEEKYRSLKVDREKADYLFKEMLRPSDNPSFKERLRLDDSDRRRDDSLKLESGTRGGGFELPEEWWLWF